jgi:hypothetical protein
LGTARQSRVLGQELTQGKGSDSGTPPPCLPADTSRPSPEDQIRFNAHVERILSEGSFVAACKYTLLVALVELALGLAALEAGSASAAAITQRPGPRSRQCR